MSAKLSVDQALNRANYLIENKEILEAQKLYQAVLQAFPKNIQAQQGLDFLNKFKPAHVKQNVSGEKINYLINLFNRGKLEDVVRQAQTLTKQYPQAYIIWNILGAANKGLGQFDKASRAFKRVTELNQNYADGFNNLGVALKAQNKLDEAIDAFNQALSLKPNYSVTYLNIGMCFKEKGELDEAMEYYKNSLSLDPNYVEAYNCLGDALIEQGELEKAINAYKKSILLKPDYAKAYNNIGVALQDQDKLDEAIEFYKKALFLEPENAELHRNIANAYNDQGKFDKAIESYNKALSLKSDYAEAYNNLGLTLHNLHKFDKAIKNYNLAISLKPEYAEALNNKGITLQAQGNNEEAIRCYNRAILLKPNFFQTYNNLGLSYQDQGNLDEAIKAYKKALSIKPDYADAYNNMGITFQDLYKLDNAIDAYNKAIAIKPDYAEAYNNLGNTFKYQNKLNKAVKAYNKAIIIKPNYANAYFNMGLILQNKKKLNESIEAFDKALSIIPDYEAARSHKLHQQAQICDWNSINKDSKLIPKLGTHKKSVNPFSMLSLEDAPERHHLRSKIFAKDRFPQNPIPLQNKQLKRSRRIRIAYFSSDFTNHPVAYLIAKVIELHNRGKFEIFAYSLLNRKEDELRKRLINSFDVFKDVSELSDREVSVLCRQDNIDIAIDLNGYTQNSRSSIFAYRAAPIQINYLGYPGTMGASFIDYIIADQFLIPPDNKNYFTEKILYLPNTFMPTDNSRKFSNRLISRSEMSLPDEAFVFCCFNKNYKITDIEFDIWMRLLIKVEGSVLWLRRSNEQSDKNIIKAAQKRNINPSRLVFAERLPMNEHLSRHKLADLFIDTFAFNAHTTTTEALWAGLPVVTKQGKGFAARVAGSLLNSIGLSELITSSESEYEELILELAMNTSKLRKVKEKLNKNRLSHPLFDTELYTKHLELGYLTAYQNYYDGQETKNIIVKVKP